MKERIRKIKGSTGCSPFAQATILFTPKTIPDKADTALPQAFFRPVARPILRHQHNVPPEGSVEALKSNNKNTETVLGKMDVA